MKEYVQLIQHPRYSNLKLKKESEDILHSILTGARKIKQSIEPVRIACKPYPSVVVNNVIKKKQLERKLEPQFFNDFKPYVTRKGDIDLEHQYEMPLKFFLPEPPKMMEPAAVEQENDDQENSDLHPISSAVKPLDSLSASSIGTSPSLLLFNKLHATKSIGTSPFLIQENSSFVAPQEQNVTMNNDDNAIRSDSDCDYGDDDVVAIDPPVIEMEAPVDNSHFWYYRSFPHILKE